MSKIKEMITEPSSIYTGSTFKIKIKAVRFVTYQEIKNKLTYETLEENYTYNQLKGE